MGLPGPHPEALRDLLVFRAHLFPTAANLAQQPQVSAVEEQGVREHWDEVTAMLSSGTNLMGRLGQPFGAWAAFCTCSRAAP